MAVGLYTDISCLRYRLDCIAEFFLHRGKNCLLQKQSAAWLWGVAEEKNLQRHSQQGLCAILKN